MKISQLIRDARLKKGLTLVQLAEEIGSTHSAISSWENGKQDPAPKFQLKLKEVLGIDINDSVADPPGVYCNHHNDIEKMWETVNSTIANLVESNKMLTETNAKIVETLLEQMKVH